MKQTKQTGPTDLTNKLIVGDVLEASETHAEEFDERFKLVYLDPPYNTKRRRGARKEYSDTNRQWSALMDDVISHARRFLKEDGFLAVSINQMELFNLKAIIDSHFGSDCFVGLFPVKIRHKERQLMINATYHDVYEYLLLYRKNKSTRFVCSHKAADLTKFQYRIAVNKGAKPQRRVINDKKVLIYEPGQYEIIKEETGEKDRKKELFRRYVIAGKLKTANWSGEWYENHLHSLGRELLIKVEGLEKEGLGYRWFQTSTEKRRSGVYFQSQLNAGRPVLPSNDLDFTDEVTNIYREGGEGCDFKDSKKPEKLIQYLLDICTREGDQVLDMFAGSGTTLAACVKSDRWCTLMENSPASVAIIRTRIENMRAGKDIDKTRYQIPLEEEDAGTAERTN